jgi:formate-dependent nitrite reductase cytochrome c552 subunit
VYVDNVSEPPAPVFAEVRERVMQDWKTEKSEELNEKFYANLRDRYTVVIEELKEEDKVTALKAQAP